MKCNKLCFLNIISPSQFPNIRPLGVIIRKELLAHVFIRLQVHKIIKRVLCLVWSMGKVTGSYVRNLFFRLNS